eukprot:GHRR01018948.1.p1 GENE.GHRR01018948.1~~GHRR01018948.1.p1  ORF type:complete len:164 (+),score=43.96 GHRR01018948.1:138-629(+)
MLHAISWRVARAMELWLHAKKGSAILQPEVLAQYTNLTEHTRPASQQLRLTHEKQAPVTTSSSQGRNQHSSCSCSQAGSSPQQTAKLAGSQPSSTTVQQHSKRASAAEIRAIRARIFEEHVGDGRRSGRKALSKHLKGRHIANWYFTLTQPQVPMLTDEIEEE